MRTPIIWLISIVAAVSASVPNIQDVRVNIAKVPDCLPQALRDELLKERSDLTSQVKDYNNKVDEFRGKCSLVRQGTELYNHCLTEQSHLEKRIGELREAVAGFKIKVDSAVGSVRAAVGQRIAVLRAQIQSDETAIRRLGFEKRAEELEDWVNLAEEAQKEFERETRDALIDLAIDKGFSELKRGIAAVGSFNPPKANHFISQLKAVGVSDPYLFEAIQKLALVRGKPARARAVNKLLDRLKDAVEAVRKKESEQKLAAERSEEKLNAFAALLGEVISAPQLSLLLSEIKFATAALYNNTAQRVSQHEVMRLTALNEQQLKALRQLSNLLERHVKELNSAKRELALLCEAN